MQEVIFIVFMLTFALVAMILLISRARMAELKLKRELDGAEENSAVMSILAENQTEIARLRERVQVLERLATDEDSRVAKEIERLRKDQGPEARS